MSAESVLADIFVSSSIVMAAYEVAALGIRQATGRTILPPVTMLARRWRQNPKMLLIAVPLLGLLWHLFIQG